MSPVNSAPSSGKDDEATAELPVLDVEAYEASLAGDTPTDTWVLPSNSFTARASSLEATTEMPPLTSARPAYDLDQSGTHEMPAELLGRPLATRPAARATAARSIAPPVPAAEPAPPAAAAAQAEQLQAALAAAERRIAELQERARIAETVIARADRITELERQLAEQTAARERHRTELEADRRRREILECDVVNLRATVGRRNDHIAMLEADLQARQQRETQLKTRLEEALAAVHPDVPRLQAEMLAREQQVADLRAELAQARSALRDKDEDLRVAEEGLRAAEAELRSKSGKLTEITRTVEEWREIIADSQKSILERDSRIRQLEADAGRRVASTLEETGEEVALEGPARLLIRTDGNTEFVHVLGRRTRIGRGSDNEIVLDTKHVSRYHAVLLAGPAHTSVEDLNSTNGVLVNGKRVTRQVLSNGDKVTIGKTQFRYTVRD